MSNDLTTIDDMKREQVDLVKQTVARGCSDTELSLFLYTAKRTGLDPLLRQVHAVKRWDSKAGKEVMTIQTGIDGYRLIADRTLHYAPGKEPTFTYDKDGKLTSATAYVKKKTHDGEWHECAATAHYDEYVQRTKTGEPNSMWAKLPRVMLAKCAEANALRKAFPAELAGVYTNEEMMQADNETEKVKPHGSLKDRVMKQVAIDPHPLPHEWKEAQETKVQPEEAGPLPDRVPTVEPPVSLPPPFPYPAHDVVLTFGKMKGKKLSECPIDYLEWLAAEKRKDVQSPMEHRAKSAQEMLDHVEVVLSWMQVQPTLEMGEAQ